jgi:hypothetical protein
MCRKYDPEALTDSEKHRVVGRAEITRVPANTPRPGERPSGRKGAEQQQQKPPGWRNKGSRARLAILVDGAPPNKLRSRRTTNAPIEQLGQSHSGPFDMEVVLVLQEAPGGELEFLLGTTNEERE